MPDWWLVGACVRACVYVSSVPACMHQMELPVTDYIGLRKMSLLSRRGQGVVYNVLVRDPNNGQQSVYSASMSYGCDFDDRVFGCDAAGKWSK